MISLLKSVNVGGRNKLPMKELAAELESAGLTDVKTYIQSGNLIFRAKKENVPNLKFQIRTVIKTKFGFEPYAIVLSCKKLVSAVKMNPFPEVVGELRGKTLHLFFLDKIPLSIDFVQLEKVIHSSERWKMVNDVFYLHTPEGFGHSKLAKQVEKILGVEVTARNWNTVNALIEISKSD